jgi:hypothetical protein
LNGAIGLRTVIFSIVAVMLMGSVSSVMAHRAPGSLTTIKWNEESGRTEVIHRLHTHDAELGVGELGDIPDLSVMDVEGRAHIALYVEKHFHIKSSEKALPLELIGAELSGDYILIYQELPDRLPQSILVHDSILLETFPAQINQVNIEDGDSVHSLLFATGTGWLRYSFNH